MLKLSKRLNQIEQMVTNDYTHIWDCCCDHGWLGMSLLGRQAAPNIHFVDIVPQLMTQIEGTLQQFFTDSPSHWKTHCVDVAQLPLQQYEGKHLIIIAGVGGDLMIQFIQCIHQQYPHLALDFLLCPVRHQYVLRTELIALNFSLKSELLVEDNKRFYECILVSSQTDHNNKVSSVGDAIWQSNTPIQSKAVIQYLKNTRHHYQRISLGNTQDVDLIIDAYKAVTLNSPH